MPDVQSQREQLQQEAALLARRAESEVSLAEGLQLASQLLASRVLLLLSEQLQQQGTP